MEPAQLVAARIRRLADPRPALAVGTGLWVVATVVVAVVGGELRDDVLPVCAAGIGGGPLGTAPFLLQRRAPRRGDRGGQVGVD